VHGYAMAVLGSRLHFCTFLCRIHIYILSWSRPLEMRRVTVTFQETLLIVGVVLLVDVTILTAWSVVITCV
jgi:hypothetical protein